MIQWLTASARGLLSALVDAWRVNPIDPKELSALVLGAVAGYGRAKTEQELELVWTGPAGPTIATRRTEQALIEVIDASVKRLFVASFVAYSVPGVMKAFERAIARGVQLSMLLEPSEEDGGGISFDVIGKMKAALPTARVYSWAKKEERFYGGKVHAKIAVADETLCFVSSANLTGHAMERNMEAGAYSSEAVPCRAIYSVTWRHSKRRTSSRGYDGYRFSRGALEDHGERRSEEHRRRTHAAQSASPSRSPLPIARPVVARQSGFDISSLQGCCVRSRMLLALARVLPVDRPENAECFLGKAKLAANKARDERKITELGKRGWRVLTVWECSLRGKTAKPAASTGVLLVCRFSAEHLARVLYLLLFLIGLKLVYDGVSPRLPQV